MAQLPAPALSFQRDCHLRGGEPLDLSAERNTRSWVPADSNVGRFLQKTRFSCGNRPTRITGCVRFRPTHGEAQGKSYVWKKESTWKRLRVPLNCRRCLGPRTPWSR